MDDDRASWLQWRREQAQELGTVIATDAEEWMEAADWVLAGYPPATHRPIVEHICAKVAELMKLSDATQHLRTLSVTEARRVLFMTALLYDEDFDRKSVDILWPWKREEEGPLADDLLAARDWAINSAEGAPTRIPGVERGGLRFVGQPDEGGDWRDVWGKLIRAAIRGLDAKRPGWRKTGSAVWRAETTVTVVSVEGGATSDAPSLAVDPEAGHGIAERGVNEDAAPPLRASEIRASKASVSGDTRAPRLPELGPHDRQAWKLSILEGMTQEKIAALLNEEHGRTYGQGQVSRMIARAKRHAEASGLAEHLLAKAEPVRSMDPAKFDMGKREDRRSPHQRNRRDSDD